MDRPIPICGSIRSALGEGVAGREFHGSVGHGGVRRSAVGLGSRAGGAGGGVGSVIVRAEYSKGG